MSKTNNIEEYFKTITPEEVIQVVCNVRGVNQDFLFNGKKQVLVYTRYMAAYFMRRYCHSQEAKYRMITYKQMTVEDVGMYLRMDHSTVTYGVRRMKELMKIEKPLREEIEIIDDVIRQFRFTRKKMEWI